MIQDRLYPHFRLCDRKQEGGSFQSCLITLQENCNSQAVPEETSVLQVSFRAIIYSMRISGQAKMLLSTTVNALSPLTNAADNAAQLLILSPDATLTRIDFSSITALR